MRRLVRSRLSLGLVLGALLAALVAAPAQAAHHTRWVDDDGGSSGGPAACSHAGFTSIQDAIDASSRWDTVKVCPGTYTEQLTIDVRGLTVKSVWNRGAHIVAPELLTVGDDGVAALVRITSYAGRLVGFELDIAAGDLPSGGCQGEHCPRRLLDCRCCPLRSWPARPSQQQLHRFDRRLHLQRRMRLLLRHRRRRPSAFHRQLRIAVSARDLQGARQRRARLQGRRHPGRGCCHEGACGAQLGALPPP